MSKYLIDTNVVIHYLKGTYETIELKVSSSLASISICSITIAEIYEGLAFINKSTDALDEFIADLGGFESVLPFDARAAEKYLHLKRYVFHPKKGQKRRHRLFSPEEKADNKRKRPDHFIAAIAKAHNLVLVTENTRDFRIFHPYLPLEDVHEWSENL